MVGAEIVEDADCRLALVVVEGDGAGEGLEITDEIGDVVVTGPGVTVVVLEQSSR